MSANINADEDLEGCPKQFPHNSNPIGKIVFEARRVSGCAYIPRMTILRGGRMGNTGSLPIIQIDRCLQCRPFNVGTRCNGHYSEIDC